MPATITNQQAQYYHSIGLEAPSEQRRSPQTQLGQDDFLELLTVQLQNQDPMNPQSDTDFIASMSSFSAVESMGSLSTNFEEFMSNQEDLNQATLEAMTSLAGSMQNNEEVTAQLAAQAYLGREVTVDDPNQGEITGTVDRIEIIERNNIDGTNDRFVGLVIDDEIYPLDTIVAVADGSSVSDNLSSAVASVAQVTAGAVL